MRLVELLQQVRPDFQRARVERALATVESWSDFEIAQVVAEHGLASRLGPGFDPARFVASTEDLVQGSAKVVELLRLLRQRRLERRKTLVFSQFTQYLDLIAATLEREGLRYTRLDGGTKVEDRPGIVSAFQAADSGIDVFLLSTKAGGVGLNLTSADCVVMMDLCFNPQENRQAEDRAHRLGQTKPVTVLYFVCEGTLEETVLKANLQKIKLDQKFGGQRSFLQEGRIDEDDEDEEEEDEGGANGDQLAKQVEQETLEELERACSLQA